MFVFADPANPNYKGNVAEAMIVARSMALGLEILRPVAEHCRYDLAYDLGEQGIKRVQCKWARLVGGVVCVPLLGHRLSSAGSIRKTYSADEIDLVAAYCYALDACYLLPVELVAGKTAVQLRLRPARNGQRAGVHSATDYELSGAVAQLGERRTGSAKVVGSSPISSILRPVRSQPAPMAERGSAGGGD